MVQTSLRVRLKGQPFQCKQKLLSFDYIKEDER